MRLDRLTLVLEIVGQKGSASVVDICAHSELPKPTVYRIVHDLVGAGLLEPVAKGRFAIGNRLRQITKADQSDTSLIETARAVLSRAASTHQAAFFLSRLRGRAVEIIHVETPDTGVSFLHPGLGKRPLHACSCSKALLAVSPDRLMPGEIEARLKAYTSFTITQIAELEEELALIRQRGYAECVEELEYGMASVAAPLGQSGTGATLSIGATGSTRVFTPDFRAKIGPEIARLAADVASMLDLADAATIAKTA